MRRAPLLALALLLVVPASAPASRTKTPVRITAPSPANATVAGFQLDLVKVHKKKKRARVAAGLPKNVSVYAVVAKQKRSDRVRGVLVVVNRANSVSSTARAAARRKITVNLRHAAVPKGYKLVLHTTESANVLGRHHPLGCGAYIKSSDLANAQKLGGPGLPGITMGTVVQSACASARKSSKPYATLGEFRTAVNAPSGALSLTLSPQFPGGVNGTAGFNYPVRAFGVLADKGHQFTGCSITGGTCSVSSTAHANDYLLFTLATPAPAGTQIPIAIAMTPNPVRGLPFQFFGFDTKNHRSGALLTSGP